MAALSNMLWQHVNAFRLATGMVICILARNDGLELHEYISSEPNNVTSFIILKVKPQTLYCEILQAGDRIFGYDDTMVTTKTEIGAILGASSWYVWREDTLGAQGAARMVVDADVSATRQTDLGKINDFCAKNKNRIIDAEYGWRKNMVGQYNVTLNQGATTQYTVLVPEYTDATVCGTIQRICFMVRVGLRGANRLRLVKPPHEPLSTDGLSAIPFEYFHSMQNKNIDIPLYSICIDTTVVPLYSLA